MAIATHKAKCKRRPPLKRDRVPSQETDGKVTVKVEDDVDASLQEELLKVMSSLSGGTMQESDDDDATDIGTPVEDSGSDWKPANAKDSDSDEPERLLKKKKRRIRGYSSVLDSDSTEDEDDIKTEQVLKCCFCNEEEAEEFSMKEFKVHVKAKHLQKNKFHWILRCKFCMSSYKCNSKRLNLNSLLESCFDHMYNDHDYLPSSDTQLHTCQECSFISLSKTIMTAHKLSHVTDTSKTPKKASRLKKTKTRSLKTVSKKRNGGLKVKSNNRNITSQQAFRFMCFLCDDQVELTSWNHCRRHFKADHIEQDHSKWCLTCPTCKLEVNYSKTKRNCDTGTLIRSLISHMSKLHEYKIPPCFATYKCPKCPFTSLLNKEVLKHVGTKHGTKGYKTYLDDLDDEENENPEHMDDSNVTEKDIKPEDEERFNFLCFMCGDEPTHINSWKHCRKHVKEVHMQEDDNRWWVECKVCHKSFTYPKTKKFCDTGHLVRQCLQHMFRYHSLSPPSCFATYKCTECKFTTVNLRLMNQHVRKVHTPKIHLQVQCEKCGRMVMKQSMSSHRNYCSGESNKPSFPCSQCDKHFVSAYTRTKHDKIIHQNLREHLCAICAKAFPKKYNLDVHMFRIHGINDCGRQVETCPICNYQTFAGYEMGVHMKNSHKEGVYPCRHCGRQFDKYSKSN